MDLNEVQKNDILPYPKGQGILKKMETRKIYKLKDKDKLILTGKQLREWKKLIIKEYQSSEYQQRKRAKAIREGFLEGIDTIKQWIINEQNLDPQPCCYGVRIQNIRRKIDDLKTQGDKRFVIDEKHLNLIKQMLKEGYSKNQIAKELEVSISTIVYWTNPRYRKRQMEKNAKRRFGKRLIPVDEKIKGEEVKARHSSQP